MYDGVYAIRMAHNAEAPSLQELLNSLNFQKAASAFNEKDEKFLDDYAKKMIERKAKENEQR